jgi:hypothetical protein
MKYGQLLFPSSVWPSNTRVLALIIRSYCRCWGFPMFRILEILRLLAPLLGVIMLISYRHRASEPAMWGIAGALAGAVGSFVGFFSPRSRLLGEGEVSGI